MSYAERANRFDADPAAAAAASDSGTRLTKLSGRGQLDDREHTKIAAALAGTAPGRRVPGPACRPRH